MIGVPALALSRVSLKAFTVFTMTGVGLGVGVSGVFVRMMAGMVYLVMVVFYFHSASSTAAVDMTAIQLSSAIMVSMFSCGMMRHHCQMIGMSASSASAMAMMANVVAMFPNMHFLLRNRIAGY